MSPTTPRSPSSVRLDFNTPVLLNRELRTFETDDATPSLSPFTIDDTGRILYPGDYSPSPPPWIHHEIFHAHQPDLSFNGSPEIGNSPYEFEDEETDFPYDDDSEDDFRWNMFGAGRFSRSTRKRHSARVQRAETLDGKWKTTMELEKAKIRRIYYVAMIKLNMRLSILAKVIEFLSMFTMGIRWSVMNWLSLAVQLVLNMISSCCILWRFSGKYCLNEEIVLPALKSRLSARERRCVFWQSFFKFLAAVSLLGFSTASLIHPLIIRNPEEFFRSTYMTAGFSTGGFLSRMSLTAWVSYMSWKGLGESTSLSAENIFSWITSGFSLETAVISFYLIYHENNLTKATEALAVGDYVQLSLAGIALTFGIKDLYLAIYRLGRSDGSGSEPGLPLLKASPSTRGGGGVIGATSARLE